MSDSCQLGFVGPVGLGRRNRGKWAGLVLMLLAEMAFAQTMQVVTPTVGFLTLLVQPGHNFLGLALQSALERQGALQVDSVDRRRVRLLETGVGLVEDQFNQEGRDTHVLEVVAAGAGRGLIRVIKDTRAAERELWLEEPLPVDVVNGSGFKVWRLWTLANVFGRENEAGLTGGDEASEADWILLPRGEDFDRYFYSTGGSQGVGWRQVDGGSEDQSQVTLAFAGGAALYARSEKTIQLKGLVKPGPIQAELQTGRNFVANLCPVHSNSSSVGRTLGNSQLHVGLATAPASNQADWVLLWNGKGYTPYFYSTGGLVGTGWRKVGGGSVDQTQVPLPDGAFVIYRRGEPTRVGIQQGDF